MKRFFDEDNRESLVIVAIIAIMVLFLLYFVFISDTKVAGATAPAPYKVICHHTPGLDVDLSFQNVQSYTGHLGTPHSTTVYDTDGICVVVTPTITPSITTTPTPTIEVTPTATPSPTLAPSDHGDGGDSSGLPVSGDGLSDGKSSVPAGPPATGYGPVGWK